jgi:hypothetical protein
MSAADALAAAFPVAPAAADAPGAAAARPRPRPAARPAAAAVAHRPEAITADTLLVADVGTFMGHRMFKTPFACWASWLKEGGGCPGHTHAAHQIHPGHGCMTLAARAVAGTLQ